MSDLVLRLACPGEDARIADFINQNFDMRLPLINRADFYQFYYAHTPGAAPQFALAEQDGEILCAAGYILANQSETPDIWVSVWVAAKGHNGVGLELMDDYLVLNSVSLLERSFPILDRYERVNCYLDRDEAGRRTLEALRKRYADKLVDCSSLYKGYKDLNEYLQHKFL